VLEPQISSLCKKTWSSWGAGIMDVKPLFPYIMKIDAALKVTNFKVCNPWYFMTCRLISHITKLDYFVLYDHILAWTQMGTKAEFEIPVTCVCCRYPGFSLLDFRMWVHMEEAVYKHKMEPRDQLLSWILDVNEMYRWQTLYFLNRVLWYACVIRTNKMHAFSFNVLI
jgi:hypothetical protein